MLQRGIAILPWQGGVVGACRRLMLPSNLTLDLLHDVLQVAFGWTDSHLHRFSLSTDRYSREKEGILTPFDAEESDEGVLESKLRLDQLLAKKNDRLHYTYNFGDDWEHTITLEAVLPLPALGTAPEAVPDTAVRCVDGGRRGPAEDVGGIHGWEQPLAVAARGVPRVRTTPGAHNSCKREPWRLAIRVISRLASSVGCVLQELRTLVAARRACALRKSSTTGQYRGAKREECS
jgi:Plasmid pRiA4b ORF-3-like protein